MFTEIENRLNRATAKLQPRTTFADIEGKNTVNTDVVAKRMAEIEEGAMELREAIALLASTVERLGSAFDANALALSTFKQRVG